MASNLSDRVSATLANAAVQAANRKVDFVHMPVVKDPDEAFFAHLADLDVGDAKVSLGIIHHEDGVEGFGHRLALARPVPRELRHRGSVRLRPSGPG